MAFTWSGDGSMGMNVGDRPAELRSFQILSLAIDESTLRLSRSPSEKPAWILTGPILIASARALMMATSVGIDTPLEFLALCTRNIFELWLRLQHIVGSEVNCQSWRNEALTDQLQVYDAMLTLPGADVLKPVISTEIERVKQHGTNRGLTEGQKLLSTAGLAKATGNLSEYEAFYKLYSKIVHPSSWSVNWPNAVSSDMYGFALALNAQRYGWGILKTVEDEFGVQAESCYKAALERMQALELAEPTSSTGAALPVGKNAASGTSPKIGRNNPCPCGSGRKYKHCCGRIMVH
jgi:uncharacterized protein YecA (UPF0149 family)